MNIHSITDKMFKPYGRVIRGYDTKELLQKLREITVCPQDGVIYEPSVSQFEALPVFEFIECFDILT